MTIKNRFETMAYAYDQTVQSLVPMYDFMQEELIKLLDVRINTPFLLIDLGAGSGIFCKRILEKFPNATVILVDSSSFFLQLAQKKLSPFGGRFQIIKCDIESPWENQVNSAPDFIVSMSTIHHLSSKGKRAVYRRSYDCLKSGGFFFNIDEMKTLYSDSYKNSLLRWDKYISEFYGVLGQTHINFKAFLQWEPYYKDWRHRNIESFSQEKKTIGDDLHESFINQMVWLHDCGFKGVDVFVKYHLWCILGGYK